MTELTWDAVGERIFEAGVDRGVLFVDDTVVPWIGLIGVSETPSGGERTPYYLDGIMYLNLADDTEYAGTIEAYTYPDEFMECDGTLEVPNGVLVTNQDRKTFSLAYRTRVGNDIDGTDHGYKIHLIYNAYVSPTDYSYSTIGETTDASTFTWTIGASPSEFSGIKPTAHFIIDSRKVSAEYLENLEATIYGTSTTEPALPTVEEILGDLTPPTPVPVEPPGQPLSRSAEEIIPSLASMSSPSETASTDTTSRIVDAFGRASTTTWAGDSLPWVMGNVAGTASVWSIAAPNQGRHTSSPSYPAWVELDSTYVNMDVATLVSARPAVAGYRGVMARKGAAANSFYGVEISNNGTVRLVKYVAGVLTVLATASGSWPVNSWLRLRCSGSTISAYVSLSDPFEATAFATVTDTDNATGTRVGNYQTVSTTSASVKFFVAKGV